MKSKKKNKNKNISSKNFPLVPFYNVKNNNKFQYAFKNGEDAMTQWLSKLFLWRSVCFPILE